MSIETIQEIRKGGEKLIKTLNGELYLNLAGLKRESNLEAIYKSHPDFREPDLFFSLRDRIPEDKEEKKVEAHCGVPLLLGFLARSSVGSKTAKAIDKILSTETEETIQVEKRRIPYRAAFAELRKEPKRTRREEIDKRRKEIVLKLNPFFLESLDRMEEASAELGFPSYISLCDEMEKLELSQLEEKAKLFLNDTEYVYRDLLSWFLFKRMELKLKDAKIHDLYYLFNSFELKANFPKRDLKSLAETLLKEMNLEIGENIKADLEERKGKTWEAFCIPIETPENIVFSIHPVGGIEDYESFFHGLGSALCYGYGEREDDFEFKSLREPASVETFAQLFKNLVFQPKWLKRHLKSDTNSDFLRFLYLRKLMTVRHYSGKLTYEMALHKDGDYKAKSHFYKETLQGATLSEHSEADYLVDMKPFFHTACGELGRTASRLKASIVEVWLENHLRERFDEQWWRAKEAGDFIRKMWQEGGRITSCGISERLGFEGLDLTALLASFQEILG